MCPGIAVLGGGGGAGGSGAGSSKKGKGKKKGKTKKAKGKAKAGKKAAAPTKKCTKEGEPVDVATGRTLLEEEDFVFPGPFEFRWTRSYTTGHARADGPLGYGWSHPLGLSLDVGRTAIIYTDEDGVEQEFPVLGAGERYVGPFDRTLWRDPVGYYFLEDDIDGLVRVFGPVDEANTRWQLTAIRDSGGNTLRVTWTDGRIAAVVDSAGRDFRFQYDGDRLAAISLESAQGSGMWVACITYRYSAQGDLIEVTDAEGYARRYTYADHTMLSHADRNGLVFHYRYDTVGPDARCLETYGDTRAGIAHGLTTHLQTHYGTVPVKGIFHRVFNYGADSTDVFDTRDGFANHAVDPDSGLIAKSVEAGGRVTNETNDALGRTLAVEDEDGLRWEWSYDAEGRPISETDPLGRTERYTYDGIFADPAEIVARNGGVWRFTHDHRGLRVSATDPLGGVTMYIYDHRGLLVEQIDPAGVRLLSERDAQGNVVRYHNARADFFFEYDYWGRPTRIRTPDGQEIEQRYNRRGDLIEIVHPDGVTSYEYDGEQNVTAMLGSDGSQLRARYVGLGWLHELEEQGVVTQRLFYDWEGEVVAIENARGETQSFEYDRAGRVISETTADGRKIGYAYTPNGELQRIDDADGTSRTFSYDAVGNLLEISNADGTTDSFEYDALDMMVAASTATNTITITRDLCGRALVERTTRGEEQVEVASSYDPSGRRSSLDIAGRVVELHRDRSGVISGWQLDRDKSRRCTIARDERGIITRRQYTNGRVLDSVIDAQARVVGQRVLRPRRAAVGAQPAWEETLVRSFEYLGEHLTRVVDRDAGETRLRYDSFSQLLERSTPTRTQRFSYDETGNAFPANENARRGPGDRIVETGRLRVTYDDAGRVVEKARTEADGSVSIYQFRWDGAGMLAAVRLPDETEVTFEYDALGRRITKRAGGVETLFAWDGNVLAYERRTDAEGTAEEHRFVFGEEDEEFTPFLQHSNGEWMDYVTTPLGTPTELIDESGDVAWRLELDAFGQTERDDRVRAASPLRYPGQYRDPETGLHYNRFRYYDPELRAFLAPDPIGVEGGLNLYRYGRNTIGFLDPLGWKSTSELKKNVEGATGKSKPKGWNAHHVIPEELFDKNPTKALLKNNGIDKNGPKNGIFLPPNGKSRKPGDPKTIHRGSHKNYTKKVKARLQKIAKLPPCKQKPALERLQRDLKRDLRNGTAQGPNPSGRAKRLK